MSSPGNLAFRSPFARKMLRGTRKAKRTNNSNVNSNIYVPSTFEAPELNMSYLSERNYNTHKGLNTMVLEGIVGRNKELTPNQVKARRNVVIKMAKGEPVSFNEKIKAGMISFPKPAGPRPASRVSPNKSKPPAATSRASMGGKRTRRHRK